MPTWMVKALAVGPGLVVSAALTLVGLAALPGAAGAGVAILGVGVLAVLAAGWGEGAIVRVLWGARRLREPERDNLVEVLTWLCRVGLGPPLIELRVRRSREVDAFGAGRRTVVVTSALLNAVADGDLRPPQVAALVAHAAVLVRTGLLRSDPVLACASLPWHTMRLLGALAGRALAGIPLVPTAWRGRWVVIGVAVVQAVQARQQGLAAILATLGIVSYALPVWERRWRQLLVRSGDAGAAEAGLAEDLASVLRRCRPTDETRERLRTLTPGEHRATLGLVRRHRAETNGP